MLKHYPKAEFIGFHKDITETNSAPYYLNYFLKKLGSFLKTFGLVVIIHSLCFIISFRIFRHRPLKVFFQRRSQFFVTHTNTLEIFLQKT